VASAHHGHHCPFLNRADARCGENFSLERLDHAYEYCFNHYQTCAIYHELLVERRVRRISGQATTQVQLTISHPHAQQRSELEGVPAVSGV
jgi:hypothetical protein